MNLAKRVRVSFEIFPPKSAEGFHQLSEVCQQLNQLNPQFISVTFGAGGGAQAKTQAMVQQLGIQQLVVVQGDLPIAQENETRDFNYAFELVASIREIMGDYFHITVAAYPEFHPRALSPAADLDNLKRKIDAGANSAITQFFYNSDAYSRFLEYCDKLSIRVPIIPGIMPIDNFQKLLRFAEVCGAEIPLWLRKRLSIYIDDDVSMREIGVEIVSKLCERLLAEKVSGFHFYTLNQLKPTSIILSSLFQSVHYS